MGGQACVLYGAAEFSRDTDLAILSSSDNIGRLKRALADLQASVIAVPEFDAQYLRKGHAIRFRCQDQGALGMRIDVMTKMRGVASFATLWKRRATFELADGIRVQVMSLPDLVSAKKTQRDKDWPMVRRLIEAHYFQNREIAIAAQVSFWLRELRTPELLVECAEKWPSIWRRESRRRPLLTQARRGSENRLDALLSAEEERERKADAKYWKPLKAELERLRHERARAEDRSS